MVAAKKVLIVEDEKIVQMHLRRVVESAGHRLVGAVERRGAALECAREDSPDLVLMDIRLADNDDGIECARDLKREFGASIVFVTAHSDADTMARAMPVGASGFLVKPFGSAQVQAAIVTALAARDRERQSRDRERVLSSAIGRTEEALFVTDSVGRIGFANSLGKRLTVESETNHEATSLISCCSSSDQLALRDGLLRAAESKEVVELGGIHLRSRPELEFEVRIELAVESTEENLLVTLRAMDKPVVSTPSGPRLMVYSHDTFGLGHIRRCLNLIRRMSNEIEGLSTLLVTGSPIAHKFELPPLTDTLKLPAVQKVGLDDYRSRTLSMSDESIQALRRGLLLRTVMDYRPDYLLTDHSPAGMKGELRPVLEFLSREGNCTRILGLRDIIDSPERVREKWDRDGVFELIRSCYEHVVIYGSRELYDTASEYEFDQGLMRRTRYVHHVSDGIPGNDDPVEPGLVVVTIGGGDGGGETIVRPFLEMMRRHSELGIRAEVLLGPFVSDELRSEFEESSRGLAVRLHKFMPDPTPLFRKAELVISTAGYNVCAELMAHANRALLIPRVLHRDEQRIRSMRMSALGLAQFIHPADSNPESIGLAVRQALEDPRMPLAEARAEQQIPLDGAERFAEFMQGLIAAPR